METSSLKKVSASKINIKVENSAFGYYDQAFDSIPDAIQFAHERMAEMILNSDDYNLGDINVLLDNSEDYTTVYVLTLANAKILKSQNLL